MKNKSIPYDKLRAKKEREALYREALYDEMSKFYSMKKAEEQLRIEEWWVDLGHNLLAIAGSFVLGFIVACSLI